MHLCPVTDKIHQTARKKDAALDRRIAKTQKHLLLAFRQLLQSHPWEAVNVQLICDTADISRSTFYAHFANQQQMLEFSFGMLKTEIMQHSRDRNLNANTRFAFLPPLLSHVKSHRDIFERNVTKASSAPIFDGFRQVSQALAEQEIAGSHFADRFSKEEILFLCGGLAVVIESWCAEYCEMPVDRMVETLDSLALRFFADI